MCLATPMIVPAGSMGQRDVLALITLLVLLVGSNPTAGVEAGPRPPCGDSPRPEYPDPGAPPVVEVWNDEAHAGTWDPPGCTGWTARDEETVIVALAGSFHHRGDVEDLLIRFGDISTLTDVRYWSVSEKAWRPLVIEATALTAPDPEQERADFGIADLVSGRDLFVAQSDNRSSGTVVYRMRVLEVRPERLVIQTENVTSIRFWLLTLFEPGDVQAVYFLERLSPDAWGYYSLTRTDVASKLPRRGHESSYINRAVALYRHFAGIPTDRDPPAAP